MGSVTFGFPTVPLNGGHYSNSERLAQWIMRVVPCFAGNVPVHYTEALMKLFADFYVPESIIGDAFRKLRAKNYKFDFPVNRLNIGQLPYNLGPVSLPNNYQKGPSMSAISKEDWDKSMSYTLQKLEADYTLAVRTNNAGGAEAAIAAALQLIWGIAKGYSKTKEAQRNPKLVEWEELNQAVNEAMDRAPTLQSHFRTLTRDDLARLREAPTPQMLSGVTFRIATRITPRALRTARPARK